MTNETTASQPKSIGDDAQFRARLADLYSARDESIELGISSPDDRAIAKLIDCIDNFRAPAAQAAATIQEPVMVLEPKPPTCHGIGFNSCCTNACAWKAEQSAAPMVADPAGVGEFDFDEWFSEHSAGVQLRIFKEFPDFKAAIRKHYTLAATVKAVPSEALDPVEGDVLPAIGSKVFIHLARQDEWVEHTVTGYYAWGDLAKNPALHRVFVRVKDAQGHDNARLLMDVRFAAPLADKTGGGE